MMPLLRNLINNLGYVTLIAFIISNIGIFKKMIHKDEFGKGDLIILSLIFSVFGIMGTYSGTEIHGAIANTRIIGVMAGGLLGGPVVGLVSGVIAGIHRFVYNIGGITTIPCAIATVLSGLASGYLYIKGTKYPKWVYGFVGGFLMQSIEMLLILLLSKPYDQAFFIVKSIYLPMTFTNALGISILILMIQKIVNEKEQMAAKQSEIALDIAAKTLPYFREINKDSLTKVCEIIKESTEAAAVAITDQHTILAHVGLGADHHVTGERIQTTLTKQVIEEGEIRILRSAQEIKCTCKKCPLKSAIIVPLKEDDKVIGTLKLYYAKENGISYVNEKLAIGLSQIISTQLEISKVSRLEELATKAEIKALQAQINPHFLFNALNTIVSFIRINPEAARELIVNLSTYMRYNIEEISTVVDIKMELEQVRAYVEIEKARFGDKLMVHYEIDENINIKIPSLIIQPLVENSIKHGLLKGAGFGNVWINIKKQPDNQVKVVIEDDGIGMPQSVINSLNDGTVKENKIGLSNVHNRLQYIYGKGLAIERLTVGTRTSFILYDK